MPIYHAGQQCYDIRTEGEEIQMLLNEGRVVYLRDPAPSSDSRHPILTKCRHVEEYGPNGWEKWWEFGVELPAYITPHMTGNSAAGWSIAGGVMLLHLEHSENLSDWNLGRLLPSPNTPESNGDPDPEEEILTHWARSIFPQDSEEKTGFLRSHVTSGDARMNPITSVTLAGVLLDLPNYPYSFPEDAAALESDMQPYYPGTTVTSSAIGCWDITVPSVVTSGYVVKNQIEWPVFLVADMYGNVVNPIYHSPFSAEYINTANVRTALPKQFARLGLRLYGTKLEQAVNAWLVYFATP